ncbi:hypothetical protein P4A93_09840 [Pseudomonas syringae pv. syringae]|uniref:hypothetical protein n=1 Tax=Pseudomonas syringae TaxID=317 RepID=UPI0023F933B9|nr:hypothetical protein [Pseudomonas syringae]MDF5891928.1 hypothetical protein [Pseudomonas syringae pv. syringae]
MKAFKKYAERLSKDDQAALERRALWPAMVERIEKVFSPIKTSPLAEHFGSLHLHPVVPEALKKLPNEGILNQLQLSCCSRHLGLTGIERKVEERKGKAKPLFEDGAALWVNQAPSGAVTVFIAPYTSDVLAMNEENIILGMYRTPEKLTERRIKRIFSTFFRYLSVTSAHHQQSITDYAWRLMLIYKDVRTRKYQGNLKVLERVVIAAGAIACIWVLFIPAGGAGS